MAVDLTGGNVGVAAPVDPNGPDGVRMTWNAWPRSKVEARKCVLPVVASITPIRASPSLLILPYAPLRCKPPCAAILNPFACVDFASRIWNLPLGFSANGRSDHDIEALAISALIQALSIGALVQAICKARTE